MKTVKNESPLNITTMSERDWTRLLTEENGRREFIPCREEIASPNTDGIFSWTLCRQQGMPPDLSSFTWKMLLDLLPSQERLHKMGATTSPLCKLCKQFTGSLKHELFDCSHNNNIGHQLLHTVQTSQTSLNTEALLYLEFADLQPDMQLPITLLTSVTLSCIWTSRRISSTVRSYHVRSELEQTINLLRTTRHSAAAGKMSNILNQMFQ